jgi:3',5'-cyclic-AMP phosphodiesterase
MRRIAHLSDVHLLDRRPERPRARYRMATRFVSVGRPLDAAARATKLRRALEAAKASGADHVVVTGDLTELGDPSEFEHAAEIFHDAQIPPDAVTLVPGNHDAYTSPSGWWRALEGPLRAFRRGSAESAGKLVERGDVTFMPIDTSLFQNIALAGGLFSTEAARAIERRLEDPTLRDRTVVLVLHHSPMHRRGSPLLSFVDGLRGCGHLLDLLAKHPRVQVLHGHLHQAVDRFARIFGAPAVVNDRDVPRVRLYDVTPSGITPVTAAPRS